MLPKYFRRGIHTSVGKALELTLAIIKPDACANPIAVQTIRDIISREFYVVQSKYTRLYPEQAAQFYDDHKDKFFFNRLVTFMASGPVYAHILAQEDAIAKWRRLMGPTKSYRAQYEAPESIRGRFGLTDTRNAVHGSDSKESAMKEIKFFFSHFDVEKWYEEEEKHFRLQNISFDDKKFAHCINL